jgi:membrane protein implicated in regulation of membrane protease activity
MLDLLFSGDALWFSIPGVAGTLVFLVKLGLMSLGIDDSGDADVTVDTDFDADLDDIASDSDAAFHLVTVQGIAALVMGFGWGGLFAMEGLGLGIAAAVAIGLGFGFALMWFAAKLLQMAMRLQSSGNVPHEAAVGREGSVYVTVPGERSGRGQVKLSIDGRQKFMRAVTDGAELATGTAIRVEKVNDNGTVTVVRA